MFGWKPLKNVWVIWQTSECTKREFEKTLPGFMQAPANPRWKWKKQKNDALVKCCWWQEATL